MIGKIQKNQKAKSLFSRIPKLPSWFLYIIFAIMSVVCIIIGIKTLIGISKPPVNAFERLPVNNYAPLYIETDSLIPVAPLTKGLSHIGEYVLAESDGAYILLYFSSADWKKYGYDKRAVSIAEGNAFMLTEQITFNGTAEKFENGMLYVVINYYNKYLGNGLTENNYGGVLKNFIFVVNGNTNALNALNYLIMGLCIILILIMGTAIKIKKIKKLNN